MDAFRIGHSADVESAQVFSGAIPTETRARNASRLVLGFAGGRRVFYETARQREGGSGHHQTARAAPEIQIHGTQPVAKETPVMVPFFF